MIFSNIIIMKYGVHAQEKVESIILRKKKEFENCGKFFWGYNGVLCNPQTQVQPFLKYNKEKGEQTYLLLVRTDSEYNGIGNLSKEYSYDKKLWKSIPNGIHVIGSKYALVCEELVECNMMLNLNQYQIAVGNSAGKPLQEYFKGRVDKACGSYLLEKHAERENLVCVSYYSKVIDAVFTK